MADLKKFAEVRDTKNINARMCVVDNKNITFMLMDDKKVHPAYDCGVWVNTDLFGQALSAMFQKVWTEAKTV